MIVDFYSALVDDAVMWIERYQGGREQMRLIMMKHEKDIFGPRETTAEDHLRLFLLVVEQYEEWGIKIDLSKIQ